MREAKSPLPAEVKTGESSAWYPRRQFDLGNGACPSWSGKVSLPGPSGWLRSQGHGYAALEDQSFPNRKGAALGSAVSSAPASDWMLKRTLARCSKEHWQEAGRSQERASHVLFSGGLAFPCPEAEGGGYGCHTDIKWNPEDETECF